MLRIANIFKEQKTFVFLIAALLIVLPLRHGFSTAAMIVLLAASIISLKFHSLQFRKALLLPLLFYLIMAASLLWSYEGKESMRGLERQLALVIIPAAFLCMPQLSVESRNKILYAFALGLTLFAVFFLGHSMVSYLESGRIQDFFYHNLVSAFQLNAIFISVFVSLSILFLGLVKKKSMLSMISMLILLLFLIMLSSKIIIVATAIIGLIGGASRFKKKTFLSIVAIFLLGLVLLILVPNPVKNRFEREFEVSNVKEVLESERFNKVYDWTGTTLRIFQARIFLEMLEEDSIFWTGYGINASQEKITDKHIQYNLYPGFYNYNFHNQYIQAFAELGIFGLLFLFLLLGALCKEYLRNKDIMFLSLFLLMLVIFMTESYLWRQRGLYHFLILYCLLFRSTQNTKKNTNLKHSSKSIQA